MVMYRSCCFRLIVLTLLMTVLTATYIYVTGDTSLAMTPFSIRLALANGYSSKMTTTMTSYHAMTIITTSTDVTFPSTSNYDVDVPSSTQRHVISDSTVVFDSSALHNQSVTNTDIDLLNVTRRPWTNSNTISSHSINNKGPTMLLVVAYLRSGSTFTASLFTQQPDSFYVFEPLHMLNMKANKKLPFVYLNGTVRKFDNKDIDLNSIYYTAMHDWLHCHLQSIDVASLQDKFHLTYTRDMKSFFLCVNNRRSKNPSVQYAIRECLPYVEKRCKTANLRVFKTIRLPMKSAQKLLKANPGNLKVIHLVRDPRGLFYSQYRTLLLKVAQFNTDIRKMCTRMYEDGIVTKMLLKNGDNNVKLMRYEDIANDPTGSVRELYKFIGRPLTDQVLQYVKRSTSANLKDDCAFCTRRGNSTLTANKWRKKINLTFLQQVNANCQKVYKMFGYNQINKLSDLRNLKFPAVRDIIPFAAQI